MTDEELAIRELASRFRISESYALQVATGQKPRSLALASGTGEP